MLWQFYKGSRKEGLNNRVVNPPKLFLSHPNLELERMKTQRLWDAITK
jgi:hypothetical protein